MKPTLQHIIFLKKWGLILPFFLLLWACENDISDLQMATLNPHYPDMEASNINVYRSDSSKLLFHLQAPKMFQYETNIDTPYTLFPKGIEIQQYDHYPHTSSHLKADYARYFKKKKLWLLRNNVKIKTRDNRLIFAEELYWNQNTEKIYSDKNIKIQKGKEVIFGKGFESDLYLEHPKIRKIKGNFYLND